MFHTAQRCLTVRNVESTAVPRSRQPSGRRIEAAQRAVTILDALAEGGELGTNELARRAGLPASTVSRQLGTLASTGLVEHDPESGRYRLGIRIVQLANAVLARLDVREIARPHLDRARPDHRRDGDAPRAGRGGRDHGRLRAERPLRPARDPARPPVDRARDLGGEGDARVRRPTARRRGPLEAYTTRTITSADALAAEIDAFARRDMPRASRSASPVSTPSPPRSGRQRERSRRSSRSRARPRDSAGRAVRAAVAPLLERAHAISSALGRDPERSALR